jgi:DNA-binding transcriptional MerR regulator
MADIEVENLLTPTEVSKILGVSERTLRRWRENGCGPPFIRLGTDAPGSIVRYARAQMVDFIAERTEL